jgi:phosphoribosylformylglycinamidine (FGAM) synthase-like amidotransferase family enzyme
VRHGEGKLVVKSESVLDRLESRHLVALRYIDNPNGSARDAAGICDPTGRIFGLMPHPEAFARPENHPEWTRGGVRAGEGLGIFENGVRAARPS